MDSVYYTTTDTPLNTSHFTPVARFVLVCGGRVELELRSMAGAQSLRSQ